LKVKKLTIWPLPGGRKNYFKTTLRFLSFIAQGGKTREEGHQWFNDTFPTINGEYRGGGYLHVLTGALGLVEKNSADKLKLTTKGKLILKSKNKDELYSILDSRIVGISEIIKILDEKPMTRKELLEALKQKLDIIKWKKTNQVNYRIAWMTNLNKIKRIGRQYYVK